MSVQVTVTKKQGNTMGTVIAKVTDPAVAVRDVNFYIKVPGRSEELGPYPPDIVRRPSPGVYEKDVVLDADLETWVRIEVITEPLGLASFTGADVQVFGPRSTAAGGTGEVRVKDASTAPTAAETLAIEGAAVEVDTGVATFNLDGRYARLNVPIADSMLPSSVARRDTSNSYGNYVQYADIWQSSGQGGFTVHGRDGSGGWHMYSVGTSLHFYSYASNVNRGMLSSEGHLSVAGSLSAAANVWSNGVAVNVAASGIAGGLSLYSHPAYVDTYGIAMRQTAWGGVYGKVTADWATYFIMDNTPGRGWIFKAAAYGNVASISNLGHAVFGGSVQALDNRFVGGDGAHAHINNTAAAFLTGGGGALQARLGSVLVSNAYSDAANVPANGIWAKGDVRTGGSLYANGWIYSSAAGTGLYNVGTGGYLYSESTSYWRVVSGYGMRFMGADNATLRGYVYHDTTGFGFLNSSGNWRVRVHDSGVQLYGSSLTDDAGNHVAAIAFRSGPPALDTVGRVGTLYIMTG